MTADRIFHQITGAEKDSSEFSHQFTGTGTGKYSKELPADKIFDRIMVPVQIPVTFASRHDFDRLTGTGEDSSENCQPIRSSIDLPYSTGKRFSEERQRRRFQSNYRY